MALDTSENPAYQLVGLELDDGWIVTTRVERKPDSSGGYFSVGYLVEHPDGRHGFLKALDHYTPFTDAGDDLRELETLLHAFNFEKDLLAKCATRRLSRVATAISDGAKKVDGFGPASTVHYLIFELADTDLRDLVNSSNDFDDEWALHSLHHVVTGLRQLHTIGISHQDIKPSNILLYDSGVSAKLADLGRSVDSLISGPNDEFLIPGSYTYAPPELLYGYQSVDWEVRRLASDLYLFGSMICFYFTRMGITPMVRLHLDRSLLPDKWKGTYEDILPALQKAFSEALAYIESALPEHARDELLEMVRQLCDPDPTKRGHPTDRRQSGSSYNLERYVSKLNLLARRTSVLNRLVVHNGD